MENFEIGVVYRKNSALFLAVSHRTLITIKNGEVHEVSPYTRYEPIWTMSVEELCNRWEVTPEELDAATAKYFAPSPEGIKPRKRGRLTRQQRLMEEHRWMMLRTVQLARAG